MPHPNERDGIMRSRLAILLTTILLTVMGCQQAHKQSTQMISDAGLSTEKIVRLPNQTPDAKNTKESALKVAKVGQKLLQANPQIGIRPAFHTIGAPHAEIFHQGSEQIMVTEALVKECSEEQLAAVLGLELAKMLQESETTQPVGRILDRTPSLSVPIGSDRYSAFGPADMTILAERAEIDRNRYKNPFQGADPKLVARSFLSKAGYPSKSVESVASILKKADENYSLEKQMKGASKLSLAQEQSVKPD